MTIYNLTLKFSLACELAYCIRAQIVKHRILARREKQTAGEASAFSMLHAGFLLGVFFYPEDGGSMFLRNVG
jgi:hypothetical protein